MAFCCNWEYIHQTLYSMYVKCATVTCNPHICVYAARDIQNTKRKLYEKGNYDFTKFVVSRCLNNITYPEGEQHHICLSCDKQMKTTSSVQPVIPYHRDYGSVVAGSMFLKALQDIPQQVCTCCH